MTPLACAQGHSFIIIQIKGINNEYTKEQLETSLWFDGAENKEGLEW